MIRFPHAECCLYKSRRKPACKASNAQEETYRLEKWWHYHSKKVLKVTRRETTGTFTPPERKNNTHIWMEKLLLMGDIVAPTLFVECEADQHTAGKIITSTSYEQI